MLFLQLHSRFPPTIFIWSLILSIKVYPVLIREVVTENKLYEYCTRSYRVLIRNMEPEIDYKNMYLPGSYLILSS